MYKGWSISVVGSLALHAAFLGLNLGNLYCPLSVPEVIPRHIARIKL